MHPYLYYLASNTTLIITGLKLICKQQHDVCIPILQIVACLFLYLKYVRITRHHHSSYLLYYNSFFSGRNFTPYMNKQRVYWLWIHLDTLSLISSTYFLIKFNSKCIWQYGNKSLFSAMQLFINKCFLPSLVEICGSEEKVE